MPQTRKKIVKSIYKDEDDSEEGRDYSDSGSEACITELSSDEDKEMESDASSSDEFVDKPKRVIKKTQTSKTKLGKSFINKVSKQSKDIYHTSDKEESSQTVFTIKDLTPADKLLPSVLNLSESDSSDDDSSNILVKSRKNTTAMNKPLDNNEPCNDVEMEYNDVWSKKIQENHEILAKNAFLELEQHKARIEETIVSIRSYKSSKNYEKDYDVNDLLAQGEEVQDMVKTSKKVIKKRNDSDSEIEDWEEVKEVNTVPKQGIQLVVDFPDGACRKKKKIDVEMMMRRKINRTKKEYQVYMHKVHVLCWLAHGNYVSRVLNDQEVLAAVISLIPSKDCYPGDRVDIKFVEQITEWFKEKITIKQDKNENKYKPKAPPLKSTLLEQIKSKNATTKKYKVFLFVSMLRAIGLQCRIMFNFVTLPIKPPAFELCSLSTKAKEDKSNSSVQQKNPSDKQRKSDVKKPKSNKKIPQVDGSYDCFLSDNSDFDNIMQVDGNDDSLTTSRVARSTRSSKINNEQPENDDLLPPKRARKSAAKKTLDTQNSISVQSTVKKKSSEKKNNKVNRNPSKNPYKQMPSIDQNSKKEIKTGKIVANLYTTSTRNTRNTRRNAVDNLEVKSKVKVNFKEPVNKDNVNAVIPKIIVTNEERTSSSYFDNENTSKPLKNLSLSRKRSNTVDPTQQSDNEENKGKVFKIKSRTRSAPVDQIEESKYFGNNSKNEIKKKTKQIEASEDSQRVSHRDLARKAKPKRNNDVTADLIGIIKKAVKEDKAETRNKIVKGKLKKEQDEDSDYLPEKIRHVVPKSDSDEDFKPKKLSPKPPNPSTSRKKDHCILSDGDNNTIKNKTDVWCEIFVEELEQWVAVDVIKGQVHCTKLIYDGATHPVCYIVGWDNNNYFKDLTRRYVPHWNTVTRKQRAEPQWWSTAIQPWLGPKTARDKEEDETLDRMQLEAPLPKSIAEYKNHPLYALRRHLLKYEAIYPPEAATLGFVRNEPVYARDCVYTCRSRDTWLKEAKVVRPGETPYKVVKARPKWDRLSNKLITDKPLEVFGPWQVQDYEPPLAENGVVPRNAYGNVELFKECMLPKGTVHMKLPGLNKVARKLNIDCAPAMTGFDFNGGWSHPVYDGFVVCKEFEEEIMEAWLKDQEDQERREREKIETRVYGNWKRLIKGLLIRERLKDKYGFDGPVAACDKKKKSKGPRLVVKKS